MPLVGETRRIPPKGGVRTKSRAAREAGSATSARLSLGAKRMSGGAPLALAPSPASAVVAVEPGARRATSPASAGMPPGTPSQPTTSVRHVQRAVARAAASTR
jgi:hypothetical protein